jgi:sec-independent protein translocase protein TatB
VFGLSTEKFVILVIIALFVLGPERLPHYAAQLAKLVKQLRRMVDGAKNQLADEMGEEFNDVDWRKLDPRQYDPRRIIRDALLDEPVRPSGAAAGVVPAAVLTPEDEVKIAASIAGRSPLASGEAAPFDSEST